jgi:hypothetical protein
LRRILPFSCWRNFFDFTVGIVGRVGLLPWIPTMILCNYQSPHAQILRRLRRCNPVHTVATVAILSRSCAPSFFASLEAY